MFGTTEKPADAVRTAQVEMRVVLPGAADAAEHLNAVFDIGLRGGDADARGQCRGDRELPVVLAVPSRPSIAGGARRVRGGHLGLLGAAQHFRAQVLDGLEAADRLAELLADLGIRDGGLQRPPGDAGSLGRQHGRGQVPHPLAGAAYQGGRRRRQHHPSQRPGEVRRTQRLDLHALACCVDQQPVPIGGQQQDTAIGSAEHPTDRTGRARRHGIEVDTAFDREAGEAFTIGQRGEQFGIVDNQAGQRGGRDRPRNQRLGRLLDHRAQVLDAAARAAAVIRNGYPEEPQLGQACEHRSPGVGFARIEALFDLSDRRGPTQPRAGVSCPIAHQLTRRELLVCDGRYHVRALRILDVGH